MRYQSIVRRAAFTFLWATATLAWFSPPQFLPGTFAQERERGDRGDRGSRRFDPKEFIPRMDANGNGTLEPNEISDRSRYFLESAAKDAGLDLSRGVSVQKMIEAMEKRNAARDAAGGASPSSAPSGAPAPSGRSSGGPRPDRGFPGFGSPDAGVKPPGFNVPPSGPTTKSGVKYDRRVVEYVDKMLADYDLNKDGVLDKAEIEKAPWQSDPKESDLNKDGKLDREELNQRIAKRFGLVPGGTTPSATSGSPSSGSGASGGSSESQRVRAYAEGLLRQYDANKNGVLDKDEWSNVRAISKDTDANNDGIVTTDELTIKLGAYGKDDGKSSGGATASSGGSTGSSGGSSGSRSSGGSARGDPRPAGEKRSYRQKSPTERLPKGLPDWFARNDEDADGQITMSEYTTLWSDSKATEFAKFDLDGDGVITPRECLRALEMETKKK